MPCSDGAFLGRANAVRASDIDQARIRICQKVTFDFRVAKHHAVLVDEDKAGFGEIAQIARQCFRLHVKAGCQHFLAGFQRHRGFAGATAIRSGKLEQVAQQALPRRPGVLRDEVGFGFELAASQHLDHAARDAGFVGHDAEQRIAADRQHMRGFHGECGYQVGAGHEEFRVAEGMAGIDQFQHAFVAASARQGQFDLPGDQDMQLADGIAGTKDRWPFW
jgi:hypothetical protein